jgi:hypothetical protein
MTKKSPQHTFLKGEAWGETRGKQVCRANNYRWRVKLHLLYAQNQSVKDFQIGFAQLFLQVSSKPFSTKLKRRFKIMLCIQFAKKHVVQISMIAGPVEMQHS